MTINDMRKFINNTRLNPYGEMNFIIDESFKEVNQLWELEKTDFFEDKDGNLMLMFGGGSSTNE